MTVNAKKYAVSRNMAFVVDGGVSVFNFKLSFLDGSGDLSFPVF